MGSSVNGCGHDVRVVARPVVHAEVARAHPDLLGGDAGLLEELLPRVPHLLDAASADGIGRRSSRDLEHLLHEVVVVQHGRLGHRAQPGCAERHHPRVRAHDVRDHAEERPDRADRAFAGFLHREPVAVAAHPRPRKEGGEGSADGVRPGTGSAAAVRRAERLVQVEVADVESGVACAGDAEDAVGVRLVVRGECADAVRGIHPLPDGGVVDARVLGVRHHDRRGARRQRLLQRGQVGIAVGVGMQRDDLVAGRLRRRGVRGVAEDRGDDLAALLPLAVRLVVRADHRDVRPDRGRTALRVQRHLVHARDLGEHALGGPARSRARPGRRPGPAAGAWRSRRGCRRAGRSPWGRTSSCRCPGRCRR